MHKGKTLRFLVVFLSGFLATASSVYAFHFTGAGVESHLTDDTLVRFWFLGVSSPKSGLTPVIPTQFQCTVVNEDKPISFRLFALAQGNPSFIVEPIDHPPGTPATGHTITITGKVLAHIIFVTEHGVRSFTEIAGFTAVGRDVATPGEVSKNGQVFDTFNLQFTYRTKGIVALLFKLEALGSDLVDCDDEQGPCTLQFEGPVQFGEISAHGSGGD